MPFEAINGFFDPSVQFGLQFEEVGEGPGQRRRANAPKSARTSRPSKKPADDKPPQPKTPRRR